jgi:hypothetical protein
LCQFHLKVKYEGKKEKIIGGRAERKGEIKTKIAKCGWDEGTFLKGGHKSKNNR